MTILSLRSLLIIILVNRTTRTMNMCGRLGNRRRRGAGVAVGGPLGWRGLVSRRRLERWCWRQLLRLRHGRNRTSAIRLLLDQSLFNPGTPLGRLLPLLLLLHWFRGPTVVLLLRSSSLLPLLRRFRSSPSRTRSSRRRRLASSASPPVSSCAF